jgi:hypothetical protein
MATGGIFTIIANDGKQDRMLTATDLLNARMALIRHARMNDKVLENDPTPTLLDIEKTHILFMNAHFKPFAAIGFEYSKVNSQTSSTSLNTEVQFSIPQFGDFFADMVLHATVAAPTITRTSGFEVTTANDVSQGASPTAGAQHAAAFRWCAFPGERLLQRVSFRVNGNPLDEYTPHSTNFYREFCVPEHKKASWYRCVGQELPKEGWLRQPGTDLTVDPTSANLSTTNGIIGAGAGPTSHRIYGAVLNGAQTPKAAAASIDLWIPLLFWFADPRTAVPSVAIPFGQRYITITLASTSQMYGLVPRGDGSWSSPNAALTDASTQVSTLELYINNIFVNSEVHDIYIRRIGFTLIRVHREQAQPCDSSSGEKLMSNLKWPIEALFVGMRLAKYNTSSLYSVHLDKWHTFSQTTNTAYGMSNVLSSHDAEALTATAVTIATSGIVDLGTGDATNEVSLGDTLSLNGHICVVAAVTDGDTLEVEPAPVQAVVATTTTVLVCAVKLKEPQIEVPEQVATVDKMTVKAHGIPIYNNIDDSFYSQYVPFRYGGLNVSSPKDIGAMMIPFGLYFGTYQPSGHINVSRAREFYVEYTSSVISSSVNGELIVCASAINFLLISDGSAVLRYST